MPLSGELVASLPRAARLRKAAEKKRVQDFKKDQRAAARGTRKTRWSAKWALIGVVRRDRQCHADRL